MPDPSSLWSPRILLTSMNHLLDVKSLGTRPAEGRHLP